MSSPASDQELVDEVFRRVTGDLSMIVDKTFSARPAAIERATARPAGRGRIHISFKLGFQRDAETLQGCLLVPLPAASVLAGHLLLHPAEVVQELRERDTLDEETKDAMLELSNFAANATEAAFKNVGRKDVEIRSRGCQGVRADVRPALEYAEGDELVVGRAEAQLDGLDEPFEILLLVPARAVAEHAVA